MRKVTGAEWGTADVRVENVVVLRQSWGHIGSYDYMSKPRPDSGLMLVTGGMIRLTLANGSCLEAEEGDLLSLPVQSRYRSDFSPFPKPTEDVLLNFRLYDAEREELTLSGEPTILRKNAGVRWRERAEQLAAHFAQVRGRLQVMAEVYSFLDELRRDAETAENAAFQQIAPGVALLENDVAQDIPIAKMAEVSGVSERTFRRAFQRYAGCSPVAYREQLRIDLAKRLLAGRELAVQEISDRLGFYDSAYFCRIFKAKTGVRPREYKQG